MAEFLLKRRDPWHADSIPHVEIAQYATADWAWRDHPANCVDVDRAIEPLPFGENGVQAEWSLSRGPGCKEPEATEAGRKAIRSALGATPQVLVSSDLAAHQIAVS
jgi:hypothetical protein